ncbi:Woronin body major protein [Aspergillus sclerotialis]|uniref:Woronin body major protein n=1 Tax=Aspergillus sclerotialis TaxID=2070753 RepID=A0A3A2ZPJ6_9EURO|nr:Woronin body major protein [Aspergillus sclerotialis]
MNPLLRRESSVKLKREKKNLGKKKSIGGWGKNTSQFERHSRKDAQRTANLDFDARVPIPFSVFPSSYRSDAVPEPTRDSRVEGEVNLDRTSRVEREDTRTSAPLPNPRVYGKEEVDLDVRVRENRQSRRSDEQFAYEDRVNDRFTDRFDRVQDRYPEVDLTRERYREPAPRYDQRIGNQLDVTEQEYRRRVNPSYDIDVSYDRRSQAPVESYAGAPTQQVDVSYDRSYQPSASFDRVEQPPRVDSYRGDYRSQVNVEPVSRSDVKVLKTNSVLDYHPTRKMGYYDDEGHYHSFRRGIERAADRIIHPHHHHHHDEVVVDERGPSRIRDGIREDVRIIEPRGSASPDTVPIPCHFIRIGDILILQGRPCQVIRITVSPQTGQYRYLGVDLFNRQLQEESSFVSNPSPSVVVQSMLGPVYKTYRILDLHDDATIVAMTETGDIKQGLSVVPQGSLFRRIRNAFAEGRGSVRALVINDGGRELVVDYKIIHASRL